MRQRRGMTLVEIMMVVAIIGSLASMALPSFMENVRHARRAEQDLVIPFIEQSTQQRLGNEALPWGAYTADWNPTAVPSRFDPSANGWRQFEIDVEGNLRYAYRLDAIAAAQPTFTVTVREDLGGRLVYRTRDWQLCSGWILLSDVRDGTALSPPLQPCSSMTSGPSVAAAPPSSAPPAASPPASSGSASSGSASSGSASSSSPSSGSSSTASPNTASASSGSSGSSGSSSGSGNSGGHGDEGHGDDGHGNDGHGDDGHGDDGHGDDGHGDDGHGNDGHGNDGHGNEGNH